MDESQVISWYNEWLNETLFFAFSIHQILSTGSSVRCSNASGFWNSAVLLVVWYFPDGYKWQWLQHSPVGSSSAHLPHNRESSASSLQAGIRRVPKMKVFVSVAVKGHVQSSWDQEMWSAWSSASHLMALYSWFFGPETRAQPDIPLSSSSQASPSLRLVSFHIVSSLSTSVIFSATTFTK